MTELENKRIFIEGNVVSGKNSKLWTGKKLIRSKASSKYIKNTKEQWREKKEVFLEASKNKLYPLKIEFQLIRKTKGKFDYINLLQLPLDIMKWEGWIPDDDAEHVIPIIKEYYVDKVKPGIYIKVL